MWIFNFGCGLPGASRQKTLSVSVRKGLLIFVRYRFISLCECIVKCTCYVHYTNLMGALKNIVCVSLT